MRELRRQYKRLADWYYELTMAEEKFYFSPFEVKISLVHLPRKLQGRALRARAEADIGRAQRQALPLCAVRRRWTRHDVLHRRRGDRHR